MTAVKARLSAMMFLQFFIWGAWSVSITGWLNATGISGITSWVYSVGPIAAMISPFFLGIVADRFFAGQRAMATLHVLGGIIGLVTTVRHAMQDKYDHENYAGIKHAAMYWHFLDGVWIVMFFGMLILG